jgi:lantibiotic modifying enzyme
MDIIKHLYNEFSYVIRLILNLVSQKIEWIIRRNNSGL